LGYGQLAFTFAAPPANTAGLLPGVYYGFLRLGGDAALRIATVRIMPSLSFLLPLHVGGNVGQALSKPGGWGFDAALGGRMAIPSVTGLEGLAQVRYTQFSLSSGSSSASDRFFDLLLGVAYSF